MPIGMHILAGFSLGFRHRRELARILSETSPENCIHCLIPGVLKNQGITVLALDFDGVLSPHGDATPLSEARTWLAESVAVFGEESIFILSNKPTDERRDWFAEHFSKIRFVSGVRKKPYPDGLQKISELAGVPLSSILMVDDRLMTGCLAAINAGARTCYIRSPYVSLKQRPVVELFFMLLRKSEQLVIGCRSL